MNQLQANEIIRLRCKGLGYTKIAQELGLSENTIRSYCRRHGLNAEALKNTSFCEQCGKAIVQKAKCKPRKFCSDTCRTQWWNSHLEQVNRKAIYSFICAYCGKPFESYGNRRRKYCSHDCYIKARFGKERGANG